MFEAVVIVYIQSPVLLLSGIDIHPMTLEASAVSLINCCRLVEQLHMQNILQLVLQYLSMFTVLYIELDNPGDSS